MNKTDSSVWDLLHCSNAISNVAISQQYITEQYDMRISRLLGDILPLINVIFAVSWLTSCNLAYFQGGGYLGYSELIEIVKKFSGENFQNRKISKIFRSFNYKASDFWNFPPNPLILIDFFKFLNPISRCRVRMKL